ncbi:hypothetical protein [Paenibacillus peoriae]|uniref:hypothetical protein n=1 Tax=Paenibacillus peoriae TaxID=59893 RepID=UPI0009D66F43|nr:hypothetical protein [Paenibacillus peoriae]
MSVKDMTDQQLNRALAELMGYSVTIYTNNFGWLIAPNGDTVQESLKTIDEAWDHAPNYCADPAASLEVQAKAIEVDAELYVRYLNLYFISDHVWDALYPEQVACLLTATPRQRERLLI